MKQELAILVCLAVATPATAQLVSQATGAFNASHWVSGGSSGSQSLPPGTDISGGASIASAGAVVSYTVTNTASEFIAEFRATAAPTFQMTSSASADLTANLSVTAASAIPVTVTVRIPSTLIDKCNTRSSSVSVAGHGSWSSSGNCPFVPPVGFPDSCSNSFDAIIDPAGLSINVAAAAHGVVNPFSPCAFNTGRSSRVVITIRPRSLGQSSYGSTCNGARLEFQTFFAAPPTVTATTQGDTVAVLLIGNSQDDIALSQIVPFPWDCHLRTNILVSIPLPLGAPDYSFVFDFVPPPATTTMQLLSANGVTVNSSNGLQFN